MPWLLLDCPLLTSCGSFYLFCFSCAATGSDDLLRFRFTLLWWLMLLGNIFIWFWSFTYLFYLCEMSMGVFFSCPHFKKNWGDSPVQVNGRKISVFLITHMRAWSDMVSVNSYFSSSWSFTLLLVYFEECNFLQMWRPRPSDGAPLWRGKRTLACLMWEIT